MSEPRYVVVEKECCGTCVHYRQHYILSERGKIHPIWYGHCGTPRMKTRRPDESCPYWASADPPLPEADDDWYPPKAGQYNTE